MSDAVGPWLEKVRRINQYEVFGRDRYYGLDSLLMLLAFMALARLKSIEALRYDAPG